jgi:hypothetical protein
LRSAYVSPIRVLIGIYLAPYVYCTNYASPNHPRDYNICPCGCSNRADCTACRYARDRYYDAKKNLDRPDCPCGFYACDSKNLISDDKDRAYGTSSLNACDSSQRCRSDNYITNFACTGYARNDDIRRRIDGDGADRPCGLNAGNGKDLIRFNEYGANGTRGRNNDIS